MQPPIVIAVFQPGKKADGLLREVGTRLRRRGLHVQALDRPENPIASDLDVVLVPCSTGEAPSLAAEIERLWSKHWVRWYERKARHV